MDELILKIDPLPKPRMTQSDKWKKRNVVMRYREYRDFLKYSALAEKFQAGNELIMRFEIKIPKSYSKKKKAELLGKPCNITPDIDNLVKAVMDSLLQEDKTVWKICASKRWAEEGKVVIRNWTKEKIN